MEEYYDMVDRMDKYLNDEFGVSITTTDDDKQWYFHRADKDGDNQVSYEEFAMSGFFYV